MYQDIYSSLLLHRPISVAEKPQQYTLMTERHLQALWLEQKYFKNLKTHDGLSVEVVSPGIWNAEAGPDFLKAQIRIADRDYKGDIEIHLMEDEWYHHGHHQDKRYDNVVFHLCLWKPKAANKIFKSNGNETIAGSLEEFLTIPLARIVQLIDLDLYPYRKFAGSGKCANACFKKMSDEQVNAFFLSASNWRLRQKQEYLENRFGDIPQQLMAGIAMALGYKHNTKAFADLFSFLISFRDEPESELLAIAFGCSGFFEKKNPQHWLATPEYQDLKLIWESRKSEIIHQANLRLDHVRPYNHPLRRLVYLVKMLKDPHIEMLWPKMQQKWHDYLKEGVNKKSIRNLKEGLLELIPDYVDPFWNHHYTFELAPKSEFLSLIGDGLKGEIIINTILPLLNHHEKGHEELEAFYQSFRSQESTKTRYLKHRFFGESGKGDLFDRAQMEQGAFQLHKDFCIHYEASCEGCPFVDKMKYIHQQYTPI